MSRGLSSSKSAVRAARVDDDANVLGRSVRIRGRLTGDGDLRIEGEIEGEVSISGALELSEGGNVAGNIRARSVSIEGQLKGDVVAEGSVVIRAGSQVSGNMNGSEIALEEGASFSGRIDAEFDLPDDMGAEAPAGARTGGRRR